MSNDFIHLSVEFLLQIYRRYCQTCKVLIIRRKKGEREREREKKKRKREEGGVTDKEKEREIASGR